MTHIVFSFETFRNHFIISLKTLRTLNNCNFISSFFNFFRNRFKKRGSFSGRTKG
ncbi:hypothetical protein M6B38_100490 [Iris pallida]|uniref:Uncharacterized protein n=1 Tax=Iris pallida TaxID=29817 RepID=A0AAX6IKY4_IRIPA|nr:hypothetical protein M6B38_100490 [Iris pallida]